MVRREFVQALLSALLAPKSLFSQQSAKPPMPPPAPVPWTLGLNPLTPQPHTQVADGIAENASKYFTSLQMATLTRLCDLLVPPMGNKPGASTADTPSFLDFLIGSSPTPRQKLYTSGLNWLDTESQKKFKRSFAKLDDREADAIVRPWLRTWMSDHPPGEEHASFVNIAHEDIRTATENSKAWSQASSESSSALGGLYWFPIEPDMHDVSAQASRQPARVISAPKASHAVPSYPR